ncbi:MAG: carbon-nitrogen hydrolase family protein [Lachnospiraceae bacterium]|nr:carbon-nitrogen hydrolase family protein [Lachnospiraceae bacterium]
MTLTLAAPYEAGAAVTKEVTVTSSERLEQPVSSYKFAANELGVVNFHPTWGDKEANIESMKKYIDEAYKLGVKILLFPEMCVTGYVSSSNPESEDYKWAVSSAEYLNGPTAKTFGKIADDYDMWIVYGATEKIEGDDEHAYNSAFACSPEGDVTAYEKIHPVEGSWCTPGETPVLLDAGEYGKIGLSICYDTYATPELSRYYSAQGCNLLLNPTATSRGYSLTDDSKWEWYYKNRIESACSREGFTMLSADLVGKDGLNDKYTFPGGSVILSGAFSGPAYYGGTADANGKANPKADIITGEEGLVTNVAECSTRSSGACNNKDFNPELYTTLYKELADKKASGETLSYKYTGKSTPRAATVNMTGYWGNKEKTVDKMIEYIEEAAEEGVDILVFPETVLSGYGYVTPDKDPFYHKYGVSMQVATAETIPGATTNLLSEYAKKYDMYIIFGMTQKEKKYKMYEETFYRAESRGAVEKVYNSAAILGPDGSIDSYQKIHRAGDEDQWSACGKTPKIIDTKWGKIGVDICRDGHFYPELGRYYAAMGCTMFIHPTATTGNAWYRESRIASYTDRDCMNAITCNLLGGDGIYDPSKSFDPTDDEANFDENGNFIGGDEIPEPMDYDADNDYWKSENWIGTGGIFNSTSLIITKQRSNVSLNGTGSESETYAENGLTSPLGLEIADMDMSRAGFSIAGFNPGLFSKMYDKLSVLYRGGYTSIYEENAVSEPVTLNYKVMSDTVLASAAPASPEVSTSPAVSASPEVSASPDASASPTSDASVSPSPEAEVKAPDKVKKVTAKNVKGKKIKLTWKKVSGAKGYEIKYSYKKSFKASTTETTTKTSYKLKKLKKGKKCFIKIRAYKLNGKKKVYGKWSSKVKVKVKK